MDGGVGAPLGDMVVMLADTEGYNSVHPQPLVPGAAERQVRKGTQPVIKRNLFTVNLKFPRLFGAKKTFCMQKPCILLSIFCGRWFFNFKIRVKLLRLMSWGLRDLCGDTTSLVAQRGLVTTDC